jgi:peroxiredoxin
MEEYPELVTIQGEFRSRGVTVLGILHEDSAAKALLYMESQQGRTFTTVLDDGERVARSYLIRGIPRTFVIDPDGEIVNTLAGWGPGGTERLRSVLEESMAERGR